MLKVGCNNRINSYESKLVYITIVITEKVSIGNFCGTS